MNEMVDMRTPKEIVESVNEIAHSKATISKSRVAVLGFLGGVYIAMGGLLSMIVGPYFGEVIGASPALVRIIGSFVFPLGLIMIVMAGAELFTGNCAYFAPNLLSGRQKKRTVMHNWSVVWVMNFAGAVFFGYFLTYLTQISASEVVHEAFFKVAESKTSASFGVAFMRGVGANWLVCLAIWLSLSTRSMLGKMAGIWFPIMAFVAIGFEHSIANMFLLPVAMMEGYDLSIVDLMVKNIIPVTLGNMVGGFLFVGGKYWYLYDRAKL